MHGSAFALAVVISACGACKPFDIQSSAGSDGAAAEAGPRPPSPSPYAEAVLSDGPVAYFRLGEPAGAVAMRSVTGGYTGALSPGATLGAKGALSGDPDTALDLDGDQGTASLGREFDFPGPTPFTLEAWVNAAIIDDAFRMVFRKEVDVGGVQTDMHNVYVYKGNVSFERVVAATETVTVSARVPAGQFFHLAAVFDGASLAIFVNGLVGERKVDGRPGAAKPVDFVIGVGRFRGVIDEVAIYDKPLAEDRIRAHVAASAGAGH